MQRRQFAMGLGAVVLESAFDALAQQPSVPVIGYVAVGLPSARDDLLQALKERGYVPGKNVILDDRVVPSGSYEQLTAAIADLAKRKVAVIVARGTPVAVAAKAVTSTVPVVFSGGGDPVKLGLVASLNRPGGNITGVANMGSSLEGKRIQIIHDLLPKARKIAYLMNPNFPAAIALMKDAQSAAAAAGLTVQVATARAEDEIDAAFAGIAKSRVDAVLVSPDSFFVARRNQIVGLAARYSIPACYALRDFAAVGGLMSYGADLRDSDRQVGFYTARILNGAKPAELPVIQLVKITLVLNRKTVDQLRLSIARDFLERADEVID